MADQLLKRSMIMRLGRLALASVLLVIGVSATRASGVLDDGARQLPVRGVVRPAAQPTLSTDLAAAVQTVGFKEGEAFRSGDLLLAFDCRRLKAQLASANAQLHEARVQLKSASYLFRRNAGSRQDLETAKARVERTRADAEAIRVQVDHCRIKAPFDGRIATLSIHEHEMSAPGKPLLTIVDERNPTIELIAPSTWLTWLRLGTKFQFRVDETGASYPARVERLGAAIDTVSQTVKIFAQFTGTTKDILPGMSGTASFAPVVRGALND